MARKTTFRALFRIAPLTLGVPVVAVAGMIFALAPAAFVPANVARAAVLLPGGISPADVNLVARRSGFPDADFPFVEHANGCGANGWTQSAVRDKWGKVDFSAVCNAHDHCFMTLGASRVECDRQFAKGLQDACGRQAYIRIYRRRYPDPAQIAMCRSVAATYAATVFAISDEWFSGPRGSQARQRRFEGWVRSWLATGHAAKDVAALRARGATFVAF